MPKKRILIGVVIVVFVAAIVLVVFGLIRPLPSNMKEDSLPAAQYATYHYQRENITPYFDLRYLAKYTAEFSDGSASWDITLSENGEERLFIDASVQGDILLEQSLSDWVTYWGGEKITFDYTVVDSGHHEDREYKIYEVQESNKRYLMGIYAVTGSGVGTAHLAVKSTMSNLDEVRDVILSVRREQ